MNDLSKASLPPSYRPVVLEKMAQYIQDEQFLNPQAHDIFIIFKVAHSRSILYVV